jgi:lysophospholipase L1-like esterase
MRRTEEGGTMRTHLRRLAALAAVAALATAARPAAAQLNFQTYVSIGDSLAAGYSSGSLVETHQQYSVPALLARQAGQASNFQQPLISEPGIPAELTLVSLPATIVPKSDRTGAPRNLGLARPYNNLAVPGAIALDALTDNGVGRSGLSPVILRGLGSQVEQATALRPTFITLWIGNNDVLGAAVAGRAIEGVTLTPKSVFRQAYSGIVAALARTGARIVAANLPDVTTIPFVSTIPPVVTNPASGQPVIVGGATVPLIGPNGPLASNTFVTLAAASFLARGVGIPKDLGGTGLPLPDEVLLDAGEVALIRDFVNANNAAIREIAGAANIPVLDVNGILADVKARGRNFGGVTLTASFLTGGLFSYDGVHLTDLGYAVVANEWIGVINANGGTLPLVDLGPFLGLTPRALAASAATLSSGAVGLAAPLPEFSEEAWEQLKAAFPPVDR